MREPVKRGGRVPPGSPPPPPKTRAEPPPMPPSMTAAQHSGDPDTCPRCAELDVEHPARRVPPQLPPWRTLVRSLSRRRITGRPRA